MHIPVLLNEVIEILSPKKGEFIIDGTFGAGGHSSAILEKISPNGILLAVDWDEQAIKKGKLVVQSQKARVLLVHGNYADLPEILKKHRLPKADGLLLDLGFSSDQIESSGKGFSFLRNEPLDMRYDVKQELTAAAVVNGFKEDELADVLYKYGDERMSRKIAKSVVEFRKKKKILETFELVEAINRAIPYRRGKIHPATRTFQALRIYVNGELDNIVRVLEDLPQIIKPGGRVAIISFHSLEDGIVKRFFKQMQRENKGEILTKKPVIPVKGEILSNPRSRSAKLRGIKLVISR